MPVYVCSHDLALKLQQEEDLNAAAAAAGNVASGNVASSSQVSVRSSQTKTSSAATTAIDKPDKKSDNVSYATYAQPSAANTILYVMFTCAQRLTHT